MPDIFVPVDTTEYSTYYRDMVAKGIVNQFVIDYVDRHRAELKSRYATVQDFDRGFAFTDADMKAFIAAGEKDNVKFDEEKYRTSENVFRTMMKGLVARDVYADQGAYTMIVNHRNPDLKAALDIINDESRYNALLQHGNPIYEELRIGK